MTTDAWVIRRLSGEEEIGFRLTNGEFKFGSLQYADLVVVGETLQ